MNALWFSLAGMVAVALAILALAPERWRSPLAPKRLRQPLVDRIQTQLKLAGVYDESPTIVLFGALFAGLLLGLIFALVVGTIWIVPAGFFIVYAVGQVMLLGRQRRMTMNYTRELVLLFRRIEAGVRAGQPPSQAYRKAVDDTRFLKRPLGASALMIATGTPFVEALETTLTELPLRSWRMFVGQMRIHDKAGGPKLAKALSTTVDQVNHNLRLQAESRAEYAPQAQQQKAIIGIVAAALVFFSTSIDAATIRLLYTTVAGWVCMFLGLGLIGAGLWFSQRVLRRIEKEISF